MSSGAGAGRGSKEDEVRPDQRPECVGWREWVSFPGLDLPRMKAKIDMGFRLLLGRTALAGQWHVDPGRSHLHGKRTPAPTSPTANNTTAGPATDSKATT